MPGTVDVGIVLGNKSWGDRARFRTFRVSFPSTLASMSYALAAVDTEGTGGERDPLLDASPCGGVKGGETTPAGGGIAAADGDGAVLSAVVAAVIIPDPNTPPGCCCCFCWGRGGRGSPVSMSTAHTDTRLAAHEAARSWSATVGGE